MNLAVWYSTCKTADIAESIRLKSYTHLTIISKRIFIVSVIVNIITAVQDPPKRLNSVSSAQALFAEFRRAQGESLVFR
jgi:hypothetical protein